MVARKKLTMSEDKKKKEESKSTLRFDNDDWIIPSEDEIRKRIPKNIRKMVKAKKKTSYLLSLSLQIMAINFCSKLI